LTLRALRIMLHDGYTRCSALKS